MRAGGESACVIAFTPFKGRALSRLADILLPMASFGETAGTYVNAEGRWQSFDPVVRPAGQTRPAWKALRVLCNRAGVSDSDYVTAAAIRDDLRSLVGKALPAISAGAATALEPAATSHVTLEDLDVPIYQIDPLVRRATALQLTEDGRSAAQAPSRRLA